MTVEELKIVAKKKYKGKISSLRQKFWKKNKITKEGRDKNDNRYQCSNFIKEIFQWTETEFVEWYVENYNKVCHYCELPKDKIVEFLGNNLHKRYRANVFDIDRKNPKDSYHKDNCCLACYICNDAKSDVFTAEQFKPIGILIGKVIRGE